MGIHNSYLLNIKGAAGIVQLGLSGKYVITSYFCHRPLAFSSRSPRDFLQRAIDHFRCRERGRGRHRRVKVTPSSRDGVVNTEFDTDGVALVLVDH